MEGGYVGHGTNAGCPRPDIELSPCIKTEKSTSTMSVRTPHPQNKSLELSICWVRYVTKKNLQTKDLILPLLLVDSEVIL
jgi:hypothetical protein